MAARSAEGLYDALFALESRRRGTRAYPIHKRLRLEDEWPDIYDWIADQIELRSTDRVLDAGCGVGFGSIRLAGRGAGHVTGLTLSERELVRARAAADRSSLSDRLVFRRGSFDELPRAAFDVVVAVESLKHSADLARTLRALVQSLAPGGRCLIVEDVFVGDARGVSARRVTSDWLLTKLYSEADYVELLGEEGCRVIDLTPAVRPAHPLVVSGKLAAVAAAVIWARGERAAGLRAFRGGLHLEKLYAAGAMRYEAFLYRKPAAGMD